MQTLDELFEWFNEGGDIAIFDATNSKMKRRKKVLELSSRQPQSVRVVFLESLCDDAAILEESMRAKVRSSPDFKDMAEDDAMEDLRLRIRNYEKQYETVRDEEGAYIKLFNLSSKVTANKVFGRITKRYVYASLHSRCMCVCFRHCARM